MIPSRVATLDPLKKYLLLDTFSGLFPAGSVHNTLCDTGQARTVTDTENKLSIANGVLTFAGGKASPAYGDPGIWYPAQTRVAGKVLLLTVTPSTNDKYMHIGFDTGQSGSVDGNGLVFFNNGDVKPLVGGVAWATVCTYTGGVTYQLAFVLRATGCFAFIKGGAFTAWTLLYAMDQNNTATLYPAIANYSHTLTADNLRIPQRLVSILPIASDSFNRANGAAGSTDGLGTQEAGGAGLAWSAVGTWAIATNAANCSALSGGVGILTCNPSQSDAIAAVDLTVTAGAGGLVLRYVDTDNYLYAYHDGTNAALIKRVAGVESNVVAPAAAAYGAGRTLVVDLSGTAARLYYNNALVGTGAVPASTASKHGLWTNNTAPTFDNFRLWAKSGYSVLDTL